MAALSRTTGKPTAPEPGLNELEHEVIEFFVRLADLLGQPRSIGEIYGLLFITEESLAFDDIMTRLNLSKGATSQGLRQLKTFSAIRTVYVPGDRRDHYEAEVELKKLATGFIKEHLQPHLDTGAARVTRMEQMAARMPGPGRRHAQSRVVKLKNWQNKGRKFLPFVVKLIGG
ncbi:MAG: hypothetical protein SFY92_10635 [Verrucomicrobiae bacterium]|nr:hypothetical protein [Verrucomicrobiae bacterium]